MRARTHAESAPRRFGSLNFKRNFQVQCPSISALSTSQQRSAAVGDQLSTPQGGHEGISAPAQWRSHARVHLDTSTRELLLLAAIAHDVCVWTERARALLYHTLASLRIAGSFSAALAFAVLLLELQREPVDSGARSRLAAPCWA